jgi:hypothetical protein
MRTREAPSNSIPMVLLVTLASLSLTGCATISTPPSAQATTTYQTDNSRTEDIFRYQSRVASSVLDRYAYLEIDGDADLDPTLVAADARMAEVCRYLNEAALTKAEGHALGWELKFKVFATTGACAQAAREVESLLNNAGSSVATAKL